MVEDSFMAGPIRTAAIAYSSLRVVTGICAGRDYFRAAALAHVGKSVFPSVPWIGADSWECLVSLFIEDGGSQLAARLREVYRICALHGEIYHGTTFDQETPGFEDNQGIFVAFIAAGQHQLFQFNPPESQRVIPDPPAYMKHAGFPKMGQPMIKARLL